MSRTHPSKSGAALIIALSFLAILTILVIAFSIQMRTDRLAARSYLSDAQGRHLLQSALLQKATTGSGHGISVSP